LARHDAGAFLLTVQPELYRSVRLSRAVMRERAPGSHLLAAATVRFSMTDAPHGSVARHHEHPSEQMGQSHRIGSGSRARPPDILALLISQAFLLQISSRSSVPSRRPLPRRS